MSLVGTNAFVTGGAGFIGSHLAEKLLDMGTSVTVYDRFDGFYEGKEANLVVASKSPKFRLVEGDILNREALATAMKGAEVVFHEAAQAGVGFSVDNPLATDEVNVAGTLNVLWSAKAHHVKRVINASSSSIFGRPQYLPIDETHPTNPTSPYGVSKLAAEQYATVFHKVYGSDVVSLRYFSVYGPRGRPDQVIHRFAQQISEGRQPVINGDGSQTRDFTHVSDVVAATIRAAEAEGIGGEVFNIGFGARTSISELARKLISLMPTAGNVVPEHVEESKGDFPDTQADNRKAVRVLGWNPKVGLDEGLGRYVRWFREARKIEEAAI